METFLVSLSDEQHGRELRHPTENDALCAKQLDVGTGDRTMAMVRLEALAHRGVIVRGNGIFGAAIAAVCAGH